MIESIVPLPQGLHESLTAFLESHPEWTLERVHEAAIALFLMQNGAEGDRAPKASYLETMFALSHERPSSELG